MFTKDDVGRKVISNEGHWNNTIGVIKEWDDYNTKYPVMVDFCNGTCNVLAGFAVDGKCCVEHLGSIRLVEEDCSNPVEYTAGYIVEQNDIPIETNTSKIDSVVTQVIQNDKIVRITPEILAEVFWNMDSSEQARFYNHLDTIADFMFPFQLQGITDEDGLTLAGRRVMGCIGEYSHWGLVPKLKYDGSIK